MVAQRKSPLWSVKSGELRSPAKKLTVAEAAATGDHHALLVAMRERIATTVSDSECPPKDLAALTLRLQNIAKEIEAFEARAKEEADESDATPNEAWDDAAL